MLIEEYINQLECKPLKQELVKAELHQEIAIVLSNELKIREDMWENQTEKITCPSELIPFII